MRRRAELGPGGGLVAAEVWGHRLARYAVAPLAHAALLGMALARLRTSRLARLFVLGHACAAWALVERWSADAPARPRPAGATRSPVKTPVDALGQSVFLNAVALGGIYRYLRGDRKTQWPTARS